MKSWFGVLVGGVLLSVLTASVWAQDPEPREQVPDQRPGPRGEPPAQPPGRSFEPMWIPLAAALDANGNGEISKEEIAEAAQALKKLDKNGDDKLTREELRPRFERRGGPRPTGRRGGRGPFGTGQPASLETSPLPKGDAEKKILKVLDEIRRTQGRMANVPDEDGRLLRLLAETIGAKTVVEIGTSNGISAIWLCLALRKTDGKLITHEINSNRAALARKNFETAGVAKLVKVVKGDAHETVSKLEGPIDLAFIDADKAGYLDYFNKLLPLVRPGGLVLAHNITPRMADPEFVKAITTNPDLETLIYREGAGMSISLKKR